jgi:hypothetical protein
LCCCGYEESDDDTDDAPPPLPPLFRPPPRPRRATTHSDSGDTDTTVGFTGATLTAMTPKVAAVRVGEILDIGSVGSVDSSVLVEFDEVVIEGTNDVMGERGGLVEFFVQAVKGIPQAPQAAMLIRLTNSHTSHVIPSFVVVILD